MNLAMDQWREQEGDEDLRLENEIMRMKLQAETGAVVYIDEDLPPEIEAQFLSHVYEFEVAWQKTKRVLLYDMIGRPPFESAENIDPSNIETELDRLLKILSEKDMTVDLPEARDPLVIYRFITDYLFVQEVEEIELEGLTRHFIYNEDFLETLRKPDT